MRLGIWMEIRRRNRIAKRLNASVHSESATERIAVEERAGAAEAQLLQRFPADDRFLPTALGNALRASEDGVGQRYGLQSVVIWPRLFHLLPDKVRAGFDDEVTQLDVSVRLSVTWALAAAVSFGVLAREIGALWQHPQWVAVVAGLLALARLSYLSAVESAIAQGNDLEVAIDLYRARVVDAMRLNPAGSLHAERAQFRVLCELFQNELPADQDLKFVLTARAGGEES